MPRGTKCSRAVGRQHFIHSANTARRPVLLHAYSCLSLRVQPKCHFLGETFDLWDWLGPHSTRSWSIFYFLFHRTLCPYNTLNVSFRTLTTISVPKTALPVFFLTTVSQDLAHKKCSINTWISLPYLKWITNKDLLYSTRNSAQGYAAAWMGGELGREWIHVHKRIHMTEFLCCPPDTIITLLTGFTPI